MGFLLMIGVLLGKTEILGVGEGDRIVFLEDNTKTLINININNKIPTNKNKYSFFIVNFLLRPE